MCLIVKRRKRGKDLLPVVAKKQSSLITEELWPLLNLGGAANIGTPIFLVFLSTKSKITPFWSPITVSCDCYRGVLVCEDAQLTFLVLQAGIQTEISAPGVTLMVRQLGVPCNINVPASHLSLCK